MRTLRNSLLACSVAGCLAAVGCSAPEDPREAVRAGDYQRARHLWQLAAERGDSDSQNYSGIFCYMGLGGRKDRECAYRWFQRAAKNGHAAAQLNLGLMYRYGHGIPQDLFLANQWLYAAYLQEHPRAEVYLRSLGGLVTANQSHKARSLARDYIPNAPSRGPRPADSDEAQ
ncbi:MAG: tetratricopeptide repeat protein [Gammaproteobacteria bacterium]|nr:tetratricopeptide repeat protein [Gammaproteobacteria bacterium]MDD9863755.1 tetratricopeptide repeat protein [Gammaproteobacteria bacterium]